MSVVIKSGLERLFNKEEREKEREEEDSHGRDNSKALV